MLRTTVELYQSVFNHVRLVLSPRDETLLEELGIKLRVRDDAVIAPDADLGMGHSLSAGATDLNLRFVFVALADMPFVRATTLESLRDLSKTLADDVILVPCHQGKRGNPVGFGQNWLPMMTKLLGDEGARQIVRAGSPRLTEVNDEGVLQDLDQLPPN